MFDTNPCYLLQTAPGLPCHHLSAFSPLFLFTAAQLTCLKKKTQNNLWNATLSLLLSKNVKSIRTIKLFILPLLSTVPATLVKTEN